MDISRAESGVIPYQAALTSSGPLTGYIWNSMSIDDRMRFGQGIQNSMGSLQTPHPLINAKKILKALRSGQLDIQQGRTSIRPGSKGGFEIDCHNQAGCPFCIKAPVLSMQQARRQTLQNLKVS
jgi:hypothetical protein